MTFHQAAGLTGIAIGDAGDAARAAGELLSFGVKHVIIKMSSQGALLAGESGTQSFPAFPVTAVDTVAAGDAFNGALAVALSEDRPLESAIRWGLAGGALAVTKSGAQESMPDRAALLSMTLEHR